WSLIRRRVEELIPDEFYKSRAGTTDSEAVFLAILGAGANADPIAATMRTLTTLTELVSTSGTTEPLDMDRQFWKPVPPGHLITSRPGKPVLLEPFPEIARLAAE